MSRAVRHHRKCRHHVQTPACRARLIAAALLTIVGLLWAPAQAAAGSTYIWNVDADGTWTTASNWQHVAGSGPVGAGFPNGAGDVAAFTGTYSTKRAIVFGAVTLTVGQIIINSTRDITIVAGAGGSLVFDNGPSPVEVLVLGPVLANHNFDTPILLRSSLTVVVDKNPLLKLARLEEDGGVRALTKRGPGALWLSKANAYAGRTMVVDGTLVASTFGVNPSVPGDLVIGDGNGDPQSAYVLPSGPNAIADTARVEVDRDGILLVANAERVRELLITNGRVETVESSGASVRLTTDVLNMTGGTFKCGSNTELQIESVVLATSGGSGSAMVITEPAAPFGRVNLTGAIAFNVADGGDAVDLEIAVPISVASGSGPIKDGPGTLRLSGKASNSFTGETLVRRGRLELAGSGIAIPGDLRIGDGAGPATVLPLRSDAIADTSRVTVAAGGVLQMNSVADTIDTLAINAGAVRLGDEAAAGLVMMTLAMNGGRMTLSNGSEIQPLARVEGTSSMTQPAIIDGTGFLKMYGADLVLVANDGPQAIDLRIDVPIASKGAQPIFKRGSGVAQLTANFTRSGPTRVIEGTLLVDGAQPQNTILLESGTLGGNGAIAALTATVGQVAPGHSPGRLRTGALALSASTAYVVELDGPTPGAGYDQIVVTGGVSLGNATLTVRVGGTTTPNATYVVIDNDGADPVAGAFAGIAEGDTVEVGTHEFTVSYRGGDGNDVVLTDASPMSYFLAEGATGGFFDEDVLIANPNTSEAPVTLTFLLEGGRTIVEHRTVPAQARLTVRVDAIRGLEATAASVQVTSDHRLPLIVERTMFWDARYYGGHTANAVAQAETRWIFAEGFQGFFDTFVLIANANPEPTTATLTFLREDGPPVIATVPVGPFARQTVYAGDYPELATRAFGIIVDATRPVIAERAMYFNSQPGRLWTGGHANNGITAPSTSWFHAEGATGDFFSTFILLSNPNATPAQVTLQFLLSNGEVITRTKTLAAQARLTINPAGEGDTRLENAAMSTVVQSDVPIVSERSMYWPGEAAPFGEGHNSSGVTSLAARWGLAEGRVGGAHQFATYILLANPGTQAAQVTVTFLREQGAPIVQTYVVPATSRFNIDASGVAGLEDAAFGARIESTNGVPIAVERSVYWNAAGVFWAGGTNALGTPLP